MSFDKYMQLRYRIVWDNYNGKTIKYLTKIEYIHHPKISLVPLYSYVSSLTTAPTDLISVPIVFPCRECHINGTIEYVTF